MLDISVSEVNFLEWELYTKKESKLKEGLNMRCIGLHGRLIQRLTHVSFLFISGSLHSPSEQLSLIENSISIILFAL